MNSKYTFIWFVVAVALLAFILVWHFVERPAAPESMTVLPRLHASAVTSIQIVPNNAPEISAMRTNDSWILTQPVFYPAQSAAIEGLLDSLQKLNAAVRITPEELRQNHDANATYGFATPQMSLVIQSGDDRREILVGNRTAPGDEVFLRVVGLDGVFVTDVNWLKFVPQSATDWRDTALVNNEPGCNSITLTNGAEIIHLIQNSTNHLWQMVRPLAARANGDYITKAIQQLKTAGVSQFITDNSNADLTAFGLQPPDLDLWLSNGTNDVTAIYFGKISTNDPTQVYAKREGWNAVVTTPKQPMLPWYGTVNDFRDPYLLELTAPVAEIEMIGPNTNHFFLQRQGENGWKIPGETFPVGADSVQYLIQTLANLRVSDFVKDVVTPADWPAYGLDKPWRQIILRSAIGDTNAVIAQLLFGNVNTNAVFVRRADEDFIYAISPENFNRVPAGPAWQFRDHGIWNFSETNVTQITVRQNGKILKMLHNGINEWSLATGSQGVINPPALEEVAHDLGNLDAYAWISRGVSNPARFGLNPKNLSIAVTLKDGQALTVDFGSQLSGETSLAAVTLDGEKWVFVFPPALYQLVMTYLSAPVNVP